MYIEWVGSRTQTVIEQPMTEVNREFAWRDGVSLRDYVDSRISSLEKATQVATAALDLRLAAMNEFRASMSDIANRSATRVEFDQMRERMAQFATTSDVDNINERIGALMDQINEDIRSLRESRAVMEGKASQSSVMWAILIAAAGLVLSAIGLIEHFSMAK